jgi:hypothetical protein
MEMEMVTHMQVVNRIQQDMELQLKDQWLKDSTVLLDREQSQALLLRLQM